MKSPVEPLTPAPSQPPDIAQIEEMISDAFDSEYLARARLSAATLIVVGIALLLISASSGGNSLAPVALCMTAVFMLNGARVALAPAATKAKEQKHRFVLLFKSFTAVNGLLWGIIYYLILNDQGFGSRVFPILSAIAFSYLFASIMAVSMYPRLNFFCMFTVMAPFISESYEEFQRSGDWQYFYHIPFFVGVLGFCTLIARRVREVNCNLIRSDIVLTRTVMSLKRSQDELVNKTKQMIHSARLASLGEMSAGIAHEINNPLAIISGHVGLLDRYKNDPEKFADKVVTIKKASERITKIVIGLKKFSRSSDQSVFETVEVGDLVAESVQLTQLTARKFDIMITTQVEDGLKLICDEVEIEQVLVNLIHNAVDAVKDLAIRWIELRAFAEGDIVKIQVIDSGKSLTPEIEEKMFTPFFTTKKVGEGTGLGLSISKGIIDDHLGVIRVNRNLPTTCLEIHLSSAKRANRAA